MVLVQMFYEAKEYDFSEMSRYVSNSFALGATLSAVQPGVLYWGVCLGGSGRGHKKEKGPATDQPQTDAQTSSQTEQPDGILPPSST